MIEKAIKDAIKPLSQDHYKETRDQEKKRPTSMRNFYGDASLLK